MLKYETELFAGKKERTRDRDIASDLCRQMHLK